MMNNTEALNLLFYLALKGESAYHPGYKWSVEYSRSLKAYFGGVGIDDYMRIFARRETEDLFQQRKEITAEVQSALGMMLEKPVSKVERSNWQKYVVVDSDEDGSKAREFEKEQLNKFGPKGLFPYTFERLRYWNIYDPNCFVVVDIKPFDNNKDKAKPYPVEITADQAIDFKYDQADLLYLACLQERDGLKRFTLYQPFQTVVLQQITDEERKAYPGALPRQDEMFPENVEDGALVNISNKYYKAIIPLPHKYDKTPAVRAGYIDNPMDDGRTKLSIFHPALPFAKKLLKTNSEADLVMSLLASPIPIRFADKCDERGCNGGTIAGTGETCGKCSGTGLKNRPTSAAEEITVAFPEDKDDLIVGLTEMFAYIHFPPEAAELLLQRLDWCLEKSYWFVYGTDLNTKSEVAQTARFHSVAEQSKNDALWPYSKHVSYACGYISKVIASFTFVPGGFGQPLIPSNLGFETSFNAFEELTAARQSGSSMETCAILQMKGLQLVLKDDPEALRRAKVEDMFNPFRGASEAQVMVMLNSSLIHEDQKIYYLNKVRIIDSLLAQNPMFYMLPYEKQKPLIDKEIQKIKIELGLDVPGLILGGDEKDTLGKIPLALQQLALARERANTAGDMELVRKLGDKMDELLEQI